MSKGMGDSWMRNDSDIFWMREVLQQMALPYRWSQDIRYIEVEFDADLYIYREDIYADVEELSINSGVRGCIPFIEGTLERMIVPSQTVTKIKQHKNRTRTVQITMVKKVPGFWEHVVTNAPKATLWKLRLEHAQNASKLPGPTCIDVEHRKVSNIISPPMKHDWAEKREQKKLAKLRQKSAEKMAGKKCGVYKTTYKCEHIVLFNHECQAHINGGDASPCERVTVDIVKKDTVCSDCAMELVKTYLKNQDEIADKKKSLRQGSDKRKELCELSRPEEADISRAEREQEIHFRRNMMEYEDGDFPRVAPAIGKTPTAEDVAFDNDEFEEIAREVDIHGGYPGYYAAMYGSSTQISRQESTTVAQSVNNKGEATVQVTTQKTKTTTQISTHKSVVAESVEGRVKPALTCDDGWETTFVESPVKTVEPTLKNYPVTPKSRKRQGIAVIQPDIELEPLKSIVNDTHTDDAIVRSPKLLSISNGSKHLSVANWANHRESHLGGRPIPHLTVDKRYQEQANAEQRSAFQKVTDFLGVSPKGKKKAAPVPETAEKSLSLYEALALPQDVVNNEAETRRFVMQLKQRAEASPRKSPEKKGPAVPKKNSFDAVNETPTRAPKFKLNFSKDKVNEHDKVRTKADSPVKHNLEINAEAILRNRAAEKLQASGQLPSGAPYAGFFNAKRTVFADQVVVDNVKTEAAEIKRQKTRRSKFKEDMDVDFEAKRERELKDEAKFNESLKKGDDKDSKKSGGRVKDLIRKFTGKSA